MEAVRPFEPRHLEFVCAPERIAAEILAEAFSLLTGDRDLLKPQETGVCDLRVTPLIVHHELEVVS